jgi:GAF domain-containing protein
MPVSLHSLTLQRAADALGGKVKLCQLLRVPMSDLESWLAGMVAPPIDAFLKAVDVVSSPLPEKIAETSLGEALRATGAKMGNVQLLYPDGLHIVAQRGFERPFLDFFACVDMEGSCGAAMQQGRRVVVADVASDRIFADSAVRDVMAQARVRSVQSTPIFGAYGRLFGVLSTHRDEPGTPSETELHALDRIVRRTARWLEAGA